MSASRSSSEFSSVTLSIGESLYTCDVCRLSGDAWLLITVEVHGVGVRMDLGIRSSSCLEVLVAGEAVAKSILRL